MKKLVLIILMLFCISSIFTLMGIEVAMVPNNELRWIFMVFTLIVTGSLLLLKKHAGFVVSGGDSFLSGSTRVLLYFATLAVVIFKWIYVVAATAIMDIDAIIVGMKTSDIAAKSLFRIVDGSNTTLLFLVVIAVVEVVFLFHFISGGKK